MQSFTEDIKNEITSSPISDRGEMLAMLSAFIRTSGSIISYGGVYGFELVTENERTGEYFMDMLETSFSIFPKISGAKFDVLTKKDKLAFQCVDGNSENLLKEMKILRQGADGKFLVFSLDDGLIETAERRRAFLKGAFLGGGSCTLPDGGEYSRSGYHFEVVFSNKLVANGFCELLLDFEVLSKSVSRKDNAVVYVKSKEVISDILYEMSCVKCLEKLNRVVEAKDLRNNANRVNNCSVSNIDKTLTASVKQVQAIEIISETIGLKRLPKPLFEVATGRLADTNASMQELSQRLGISKSCLNHRFRKIQEMASQLSSD